MIIWLVAAHLYSNDCFIYQWKATTQKSMHCRHSHIVETLGLTIAWLQTEGTDTIVLYIIAPSGSQQIKWGPGKRIQKASPFLNPHYNSRCLLLNLWSSKLDWCWKSSLSSLSTLSFSFVGVLLGLKQKVVPPIMVVGVRLLPTYDSYSFRVAGGADISPIVAECCGSLCHISCSTRAELVKSAREIPDVQWR